VKRYIDFKSRTRDQMEQAARSGKQNIAEATANSKQKPKSELMLLGVASASLKELLEDYKDYSRQHGLEVWEREDARALAVRKLMRCVYIYPGAVADRSSTTLQHGKVGRIYSPFPTCSPLEEREYPPEAGEGFLLSLCCHLGLACPPRAGFRIYFFLNCPKV